MKSKITGGETDLIFTAKLLGKYDVKYYKCRDTGFIQTEEPYWLEEAYSSAITKLDMGLAARNVNMAEVTRKILFDNFDHTKRFLDYAGGYGLFTRLMRDRGYDFYSSDIYCENIFAEYWDLKELKPPYSFEAVTAFEVLEHLPEPIKGIEDILQYSRNFFFSTEILPENDEHLRDWWYLSFETGQHIAFYTVKALKYLADKFNLHFYTNNQSLHLFTEKPLAADPFAPEEERVIVPDTYLIDKLRRKVKRWDNRNNPPKPVKHYDKEGLMGKDIDEAKRRIAR